MDILNRVFYDVKLNFLLKKNKDEEIKILDIHNLLDSDSTLINNFLIVKPDTNSDLETKILFQETKSTISIQIINLSRNVAGNFDFIKTESGYFLDKKTITVE